MANNMFDLDARVKSVNTVSQAVAPASMYTYDCYTYNCYTSTCYTNTCYSADCYTGQNMCGYTHTTSC